MANCIAYEEMYSKELYFYPVFWSSNLLLFLAKAFSPSLSEFSFPKTVLQSSVVDIMRLIGNIHF